MGNQIIRQPSGKFAIFCTSTDTIIVWDAIEEEIVEWFVDRAVEVERRTVRGLIEHVAAGNARRAYFQFAKTWEQALAIDREHGGEVSALPTEETT